MIALVVILLLLASLRGKPVVTAAVITGSVCATAAVVQAAEPPPATDYILRLIGRHSSAHACPIAPKLALTNAHVVDIRPFDPQIPAYPYQWSDGSGNSGVVLPQNIERSRDLATLVPLQGEFPRYLSIASQPPRPGDRVWFLGYSWSNRKSVFEEDVIEARVSRIVARHVVFYPAGQPGSSGSCVVNERGEVVGINSWGMRSDSNDEAGVAVGVWGGLAEAPK